MRGIAPLLAVLAASVLLVILFVAGCFRTKISAPRAAAILKRDGGPTWKRVTCGHSQSAGWDYTCVVVARPGGRFSVDIRVNGDDVTEQDAP